jgi:hypothetical protein
MGLRQSRQADTRSEREFLRRSFLGKGTWRRVGQEGEQTVCLNEQLVQIVDLYCVFLVGSIFRFVQIGFVFLLDLSRFVVSHATIVFMQPFT